MKRLKQLGKYVGYVLFGGVLWGLAMYFIHTWIAGHSLLIAYLVNLVLIVMALISDELTFKVIETSLKSEEYHETLKKSGFIRFFLDAFISFKAILYLFYIVIMVFSQVIGYYPSLVPESLVDFIAANEYSILILIAVDLFSGQLQKDKQRRTGLFERFKLIVGEEPSACQEDE